MSRPAPSLLLAAADSFLRCGLYRIALAVYGNDAARLCRLLETVFTLELELLRLELVALLHEVVDGVNPAHLDRFRGLVHIAKVGQDLLVELGHDDLLVLILKIAGAHHVVHYLLKGLAEGRLAVNVRLTVICMLHLRVVCLICTGTFHHIFFGYQQTIINTFRN